MHHILVLNVGPKSKPKIFTRLLHHVHNFLGDIALTAGLAGLLNFSNFFVRETSVLLHVHKDVRTNVVKLFISYLAKLLLILLTPFLLFAVINCSCCSRDVLHFANDVFGNLTVTNARFHVREFRLFPFRDETCEITFVVRARQVRTGQVFWVKVLDPTFFS